VDIAKTTLRIPTELIELQLDQDVGVRTKSRDKAHYDRRMIEPVTAYFLGRTSFTALECSHVA
jgi:hypothetical protein